MGGVVVHLDLDNKGYSSGISGAIRANKQFKQSVDELGHGTVSQMQAASASIRLVEGDMSRSVRAVERFITTIPGVGKALQAAFPLVGAAATVGILVRIGEEAYQAVQKVRQMGSAIQSGMESITASGRLANDQMAVTNARLQEEIDKLEHKPGDGLASALAEAQVNADKLFDSLKRDNEEIAKVLNANQSGFLAQVMGKAPSGETNQFIQDQMTQLENAGRQVRDAATPQDRDAASAKLMDRLRTAVSSIEQMKQQNSGGVQGGVDFSNNFNALDATESIVKNQIRSIEQGQQQVRLQQQKASDEKIKQQQEDAKKAAAAMKEAQNQIAEAWRLALDSDKANGEVSTAQEAAYWDYRAQTAKKGSLSYIKALDEANKAIARINAQTMELRKAGLKTSGEFEALSGGSALDHQDDTEAMGRARSQASQYLQHAGNQIDLPELKDQGKAATEYLKNLNDGIMLQRQNANAIAEAALQMALMTGQVGKLDAAQAQAALHAKEFNEQMQDIADAIEKTQQLPDGFEKQQRLAGLKAQENQTVGQRQIQVMSDNQGISDNTISGAVKASLNQMVTSFTDMAENLRHVIPETLNSLNDDISKLATGQGQKGDFGRTFLNAGQGLVKTGLQGAEGMALKWLSHGKLGGAKADGSQANPYHVIIAGQPGTDSVGANPIGAIAGQAMSKIGGTDGGGGFSGFLGKFIRPFVGSASSFLPHFAAGGDVAAGQAIWTGEKGPEPFIPKTAGTIIPNHAIGGGDSTHYHFNIQGNQDPMAVRAAIVAATPHIAAATLQAHHSMAKRSPRGR
jgi:hypothetical protein